MAPAVFFMSKMHLIGYISNLQKRFCMKAVTHRNIHLILHFLSAFKSVLAATSPRRLFGLRLSHIFSLMFKKRLKPILVDAEEGANKGYRGHLQRLQPATTTPVLPLQSRTDGRTAGQKEDTCTAPTSSDTSRKSKQKTTDSSQKCVTAWVHVYCIYFYIFMMTSWPHVYFYFYSWKLCLYSVVSCERECK